MGSVFYWFLSSVTIIEKMRTFKEKEFLHKSGDLFVVKKL